METSKRAIAVGIFGAACMFIRLTRSGSTKSSPDRNISKGAHDQRLSLPTTIAPRVTENPTSPR